MNLIDIPKKSKDECIKSFTKYFLENDKYEKYEKLSELTKIGELGEKNLRGMAWKIFMNVLPVKDSLEKWVENISYSRTEYKILSDKIIKEQNYFEEIKKEKEINHNNQIIGNFSRANSFYYNPFHDEKEMIQLINLDLNRTFQELSLFHDEKIKNKLSNILVLWNKLNMDLGYQQGMNDILSIIFLSLYPYYFPNEHKINNIENVIKTWDKNERINKAEDIYMFFHDEDELESDLFICFSNIMKNGVKSLYDFVFESKEKQINYIQKHSLFEKNNGIEKEEINTPLNIRCKLIINEKLKKLDSKLYEHFNKIGLDCTIFLQKWLKCMFDREFELKDTLILWDVILSDKKKEYDLVIIDIIALSMILRIRNILLLCDQNQCFMMMLQYPRIDNILELIIFSEKLYESIKDLNKGIRSIFLDNVKSFIVNGDMNDNNKNIKKNEKNNIENKEIMPVETYEEGIKRLGNLYTKYNSLMSITDKKEFITIIHFFNNYQKND